MEVGFFVAKYSYEFKLQVVQDYLNKEGGCGYLAQKYDIPHREIIKKWVNAYKTLGEDGLKRSRHKRNYSFEEKLSVVELYMTTEISYQELANQLGMNNPPLIVRWVNDYRIAGPDALRPKKKGRKKTLKTKKKSSKDIAEVIREVDTSEEHVKALEEELLRLRIENAYLKELRRLRLEEEKRQRERQE